MEMLASIGLNEIQAYVLIFLVVIGGLVTLAELILRFIPTEKEDGFIKRLGDRIDAMLNLMKVPNKIKEPPMPGEKKSDG